MNCTAANTRARNLPVAAGYWRQHYWSAPPNGSLSACFTEEACLGGANLSADIFCAPSQQGPYCAVCRDGYFGGGDGALCEPCEGHAVITFLPVVLIGIVLLAVLTYVIISCYRKEDILGALITASSECADAVASELEDADATSTFGLVGTAVDTVRDKAVEQTEARAKDWAVRHIADQMETNDVKAKFAKAKKTDAERDAERLKAAVHHKYPKTVARARWFKAKAEALGVKLKILISLYQMLQGIGITFNIRWPEAYGDALRFLGSVVQIDLPQAMPMDCIANFGFFGALIVRTAIPLLLVMLLAGLSKLFRRYEKVEIANMFSSGWFVVLFLVYPSCSTAVFQAFMCDELDDGSAYLRVDYSMQCYAENKGAYSEDYKGVMAYAILMSFVYPLGTPLLYTAVLYANRVAIAKVDRLERGLMKFIKSPETEDATGKLREAVHEKIRQKNLGSGGLPRLTGGYEMRVYWFEVFECVRKICLIGLPIFVDPGSSAQLIVGLLVCFVSYGMYASYEPYIKDSDDWLAKVCQVSLFFSLVSSIALKIESDSSTEALGVLLVFTLMVPPVTAFLFESDIDFEAGCYISYIKKRAVHCFTITLSSCFDHYLREESVGSGTTEDTVRHGDVNLLQQRQQQVQGAAVHDKAHGDAVVGSTGPVREGAPLGQIQRARSQAIQRGAGSHAIQRARSHSLQRVRINTQLTLQPVDNGVAGSSSSSHAAGTVGGAEGGSKGGTEVAMGLRGCAPPAAVTPRAAPLVVSDTAPPPSDHGANSSPC